jgi:hypothetical protein
MGFFSRSALRADRRANSFSARRFRPGFETLERRDCPSTMWLSVSESGPNHTVMLTGQVSNPNPGAGMTIQFSGACNCSTVTAADGTFFLSCPAATLGTITASASNGDNTICSAQAVLTSRAPTITSFQAVRGTNNLYTFSGRVSDEFPAGLTVQFSGIEPLGGQTATVAADGSFSISVFLPQGETGEVSVQVTDWWSLQSSQASVYVSVS